jgi:stearoyl-CoA desaturase (delta-9 desaturase)
VTEGRPSATLTSAAEKAATDRRVDDEERSLTGHAYGAAREDATAPITHGKDSQSLADRITVAVFVAVPIIAVLAAIPFAWGWGIGWVDVLLGATFFALTSHGITIGFHRYFTHGSFKANRPLKIALAIAGSLAIEGPLARWVADHRKHHAHSDSEGDPHSPWAYGDSTWGLTKGLWHAHIGWFFDVEQTPLERYVPDLLRDRDLVRVTRQFPLLVATSLLLPAILGALLTWSWQGAVTAFFWATLVRVGLVHHVTWSINSVCHVWGKRPFKSRDHSGNVAWLAILSGGESWHNLHHSDPTCARHGVLKWQLDSSARIIELFEWFGWATDVRWPKESRLAARRTTSDAKA